MIHSQLAPIFIPWGVPTGHEQLRGFVFFVAVLPRESNWRLIHFGANCVAALFSLAGVIVAQKFCVK